jgi:mannose-6-phosphate isomerase
MERRWGGIAVKLNTHFVPKPWGRLDISPIHNGPAHEKIGEVWFDQPDDTLPILVKWLFTSERLSIQVHPNDTQARERGLSSGKEECWFVTAADADARLGIGTLEPLTPLELADAIQTGRIVDLMDWKPVKTGDYFFIPAGTVHAIGAGITLVEVQQNADVTYRLFDYDRPRELHIDDGILVSDPKPYEDMRFGNAKASVERPLVTTPHFQMWYAADDDINRLARLGDRCWIIPVSGSANCDGEPVGPGECLLAYGDAPLTEVTEMTALVVFESALP